MPFDFGSPTPDSTRELSTVAAELADYFEWSYQVARKVTGLIHWRTKFRYNEQVVTYQ